MYPPVWVTDHATALSILGWSVAVLALASALAAAAPDPDASTAKWMRSFSWLRHPLAFALLVASATFLLQTPAAVSGILPNPDEAQFVAGALTLRDYPLFWESVDGTTSGPLNFYVLLLPCAFGVAPSYASARFVGVALMVGAMLFVWLALRGYFDELSARLAALAGAGWLGFTTFWDYVQYSSERVAVFLMAAAVWLLACAFTTRPGRPRRVNILFFATGAVLAAMPLAKLQSAPLVLSIFAVATLGLWFSQTSARGFAKAWGTLIAGAMLPLVALAVYLGVFRLWPQFWTFYILDNLFLAESPLAPRNEFITQFLNAMRLDPATGAFLIPCMAFSVIILVTLWRLPSAQRGFTLGAVLLWIAGFVAYAAPARYFTHYLQFVIVPTALVAGAALGGALAVCREHRWPFRSHRRRYWALAATFALATLVPQIADRLRAGNIYLTTGTRLGYTDSTPAGRVAARLTQPGDRIAIWGWMAGIYVESGRAQATREAHTWRQIESNPLRDAYRERFLSDLQRSQPAAFVDAVGGDSFGYPAWVRAEKAHESWPELRDWVAAHYSFAEEVDGIRIYVRKHPPSAPAPGG